jgi:thiol:disulfide interchange protein DsbD
MMLDETRWDERMSSKWEFIRQGTLLFALLASLVLSAGAATSATGPHGSVDLVADVTSVEPSRPFRVGLHFQLESGWHIYWTNPGDSGEPPRVKWDLPTGFAAGPLLWPAPRRIEDHSLIDYGYQNEVLLPVEIKPPAAIGTNSGFTMSASVNWLVCREICVPGRSMLSLTLPIQKGTPAPPSSLHPLFVKARAALPNSAPKAWKAIASLGQRAFILNVDMGSRQTVATFFPLEPNQIENAAPQKVIPSARGFRLEMVKSAQLITAPSRLTGVLELAAGQGYFIEAPVITRK